MALLRSLLVSIEANSAKLVTEIQKATQSIDKMKSSLSLIKFDALANLGQKAFQTGQQLYGLAKATVDWADDLQDTAKAIGLTVSQLQRWQFIAKTAGIEQEQLGLGLRTFINNMDTAKKGTGEAAEAFKQAGITSTDLDEALLQAADAFSKMEDGTSKASLAMQLFGNRAGLSMIEIMDMGREKIQQAAQRMRELGLEFGEDKIAKLANYKQSIEEMSLKWKVFAVEVAPLVMKGMQEVGGSLEWWTVKFTQWSAEIDNIRAKNLLAMKKELADLDVAISAGIATPEMEQRANRLREIIGGIAQKFQENVPKIQKSNKEIVESIDDVVAEIQDSWGILENIEPPARIKEWVDQFDVLTYELGDKMQKLGVVSQKSLENAAQDAINYVKAVEKMAAAGKASNQDLINAYNAASEAMKKLPKTAEQVAKEIEEINKGKTESLVKLEEEYQAEAKRLADDPEKAKKMQEYIDKVWGPARKKILEKVEKDKLTLKATANVDEARQKFEDFFKEYNNKTITMKAVVTGGGAGGTTAGANIGGSPYGGAGGGSAAEAVSNVGPVAGPIWDIQGSNWYPVMDEAERSYQDFKNEVEQQNPQLNVSIYGTGSTKKPISEKLKEIVNEFGGLENVVSGIEANINLVGASAAYEKLEAKLKLTESVFPGVSNLVTMVNGMMEISKNAPLYLQQAAIPIMEMKAQMEQLRLQMMEYKIQGSYQAGGYVRRTGLAFIHEGEYVQPKGGVTMGNISINVPRGTSQQQAKAIANELAKVVKYRRSSEFQKAIKG